MSQETLRADRAVASSTGQRLWSCLLGLHVRQAERRQLEIPRGKLSDGNPLARQKRIRPAERRALFFRCRFEVSIQVSVECYQLLPRGCTKCDADRTDTMKKGFRTTNYNLLVHHQFAWKVCLGQKPNVGSNPTPSVAAQPLKKRSQVP